MIPTVLFQGPGQTGERPAKIS